MADYDAEEIRALVARVRLGEPLTDEEREALEAAAREQVNQAYAEQAPD